VSKYRLLIALAHPDDESFGSGGLISKYVAEGVDVYLICATDGDMGTIPEDMKGQFDTVRELRLAELECASKKLGFRQVFTYGYKDSGMMGTESTNDPDCLWYQWNYTPESVTRRVVETIREVRPHVVLTFNRYGGYGHPDHIAIQRATTEAFSLSADAGYVTQGFEPFVPQKLYYSSIPGRLLKLFLFVMKIRGQDVRRMGVNKDIDFQAIIDHIEPVHAVVDIVDYLDAWDEASSCHKSQGGGGGGFIGRFPMWLRRLIAGKQSFTRVYPVPNADRIDEMDLFTNIESDDMLTESAM